MKSLSLIGMHTLSPLNQNKKMKTSFEGKSGGWEDSDKRRYSHHMEQVEAVLE